MDLPLLKYHLEEVLKLIEEDKSYNPLLVGLYNPINDALRLLKDIKQTQPVPLVAHRVERKKRQILEKFIKQIQENPDCPEKVKIRIVEVRQEMVRANRKPCQDSRKKATAEGR